MNLSKLQAAALTKAASRASGAVSSSNGMSRPSDPAASTLRSLKVKGLLIHTGGGVLGGGRYWSNYKLTDAGREAAASIVEA